VHVDGAGRLDRKVEPRRRNSFQLKRVRKELKELLARFLDQEFRGKSIAAECSFGLLNRDHILSTAN
jgi:hypothetical protein